MPETSGQTPTGEQIANEQLLYILGGLGATAVLGTGAVVVGAELTGVTDVIPNFGISKNATPGAVAAEIPGTQVKLPTATLTPTTEPINFDTATASLPIANTPTPGKVDVNACIQDPTECGIDAQETPIVTEASPSITNSPTPGSLPTLEPSVTPGAVITPLAPETITTDTGTVTLENGFVLPENYPTDKITAGKEFGGKSDFWRMDTYTFINGQRYNVVDEIPYDNTGKAYAGSDAFTVMWGGAWVAEARPLRTDGIRNSDGTLYDYTKTPEYFQLSLGQFDKSGTASATWWNGKTNTYGSGSHSLDQGDLVEQAVIWAVPKSEVCETDAQQKMLASKHAMETLFKFLSTDANAAKTNVMTWDPVKGEYTSYKPGELPTGIEFDMENLPYEGHPLNTKDVSTNGGKPEQWAMDLYKDPISGNVKWGFTWNFEGRNLKTPFRINGAYFNPLTGEVMSMDQVFDLNGPVSKAVIRTPNGSIRLTYWDGQENTYGAGGADEGTQTPYAVEQAVLKTALPHNGCYDVNMHNPNLQKDGVGADIRQFIATDPNIAKIKAAVWDPIQKMWQMFAPGAIVNNIPAWLK